MIPLRLIRAVSLLMLLSGACRIPSGATGRNAIPAGGGCPEASPTALPLSRYLERLPKPPVTVALDVDDTALFSTPAFLHGRGLLLPTPPAERGTPDEQLRAWRRWYDGLETERSALFDRITSTPAEALTPAERAQWERFWDDVNTAGDEFSPPKAGVRAIVRHHLRRGDTVLFVTARPIAHRQSLEAKLRSDFESDTLTVEFTALRPKSDVLRSHRVAIYYGDSDGDMEDAKRADAIAVRILRSRYSSNRTRTSVGTKGECYVVEDSDL